MKGTIFLLFFRLFHGDHGACVLCPSNPHGSWCLIDVNIKPTTAGRTWQRLLAQGKHVRSAVVTLDSTLSHVLYRRIKRFPCYICCCWPKGLQMEWCHDQWVIHKHYVFVCMLVCRQTNSSVHEQKVKIYKTKQVQGFYNYSFYRLKEAV